MAVYEYECWKCREVFEVEHGMNDRPDVQCPKCGETGWVDRIISKSSFVLKGKGWGKDGYK